MKRLLTCDTRGAPGAQWVQAIKQGEQAFTAHINGHRSVKEKKIIPKWCDVCLLPSGSDVVAVPMRSAGPLLLTSIKTMRSEAKKPLSLHCGLRVTLYSSYCYM